MKRAKVFIAVLLMALIPSMLMGCQKDESETAATTTAAGEEKQGEESKEEEKKEIEDYGLIRIGVAQGGTQHETPEDNDLVEEEINAMLLADRNAKVDLEVVYFTKSQRKQEINIKIASGERLDIIGQYWNDTPGFMQPMDEYLDKYGQNIKKLIPGYAWDNVTIDGNIMAITCSRPQWALNGGFAVRSKLLDEAGIENKPSNIEEVEAMLAKFKEMGYIAMTSFQTEFLIMTFGGTIEGYKGSHEFRKPLYIDEAGNVMPEIVTPANLEMTMKIRSWVEKEYLPGDYVTMNAQTMLQLIKTGKVASWVENNLGWSGQTYEAMLAIDPDERLEIIPWLGKKPKISPVATTVCFTPNTKNFEGTIKYFDWICSDYENYYTAAYGINGVHRHNDYENMTTELIDTVNGRKTRFLGRGLVGILNLDTDFGKRMQEKISPDSTVAQIRTQEYHDTIYKTYVNWPDDKKVKNPFYNYRVRIEDDSLRTSMEEEYKTIRQKRDSYIIEGDLEAYKKALDEFKQAWETKYMKIFTDVFNKAAGNR